MARRTFEDIVANVLVRLGNRGDATPELRAQWANDALLAVASMVPHTNLEGTETGLVAPGDDSWEPLAVDVWWPKLLKCTSSGKVLEPDNQEAIERPQEKSQGHPSRYYYFGNGYVFNTRAPAEGSVMKLWFYRKPSDWTTGVSPLQREFDLIVEHYAVKVGLEYFREFEKAAITEALARNLLADLNLPVRQARLEDNAAGLRPRTR